MTACQILAVADPKAAFFPMPMRLWQFAMGAAAAVDSRVKQDLRGRRFAPALQWMSLAAIIATPWLARQGDLWPAPGAVPACLGAALLITLGGAGQCGRLLASRPLVFTGRISYSLYLVHWPVAVFVGYAQFPQPPVWLRVLALIACIPLAMLLYRFVEAPMRAYGRAQPGYGRATAGFAALAFAIIGLGYLAHFAPSQLALGAAPLVAQTPLNTFACKPWKASNDVVFCKIGDVNAEPSALLWGDSHAMHFAQGFAQRLARDGGAMLIAVNDACPPAVGVWRVSNGLVRREDCPRGNAEALAMALTEAKIRTVFIAARWAYYAETTRFGAEKGGRAYLISDRLRDRSVATSRRLLEERLDDEVHALTNAGKNVVFLGQVPELGFDGARCAAMRAPTNGAHGGCAIARAQTDARQMESRAILARVSLRNTGAQFLDPTAVFCNGAACGSTLAGQPAYRDDNHLVAGAAAVVLDTLLGRGPASGSPTHRSP